MAYTALYNKYRPQSFEEVAGQQVIVRTLKNAIANDKIAHAYLFCGPRGTGKTTMARLFAKALNCSEGLGHQCNHCSNCEALNNGSHPDVVEIDAASNNGVDQVRELIERVNYAPIRGRYKIYIIDEVHMMSQGAFNALLKTLEEPPEHVIFILATTEPHKVLPTILSRCQRYDFGKIEPNDMKAKLIEILGKENVSYDDGALSAIIDLSDGGMRDALSILDQVLAFAGTSLKEDDVLSVFGLASTKEKVEYLNSIVQGDVVKTLAKLNDFLTGGIDIKRLIASLLEVLKDVLIYKRTKRADLCSSLKEGDAKLLAEAISFSQANKMIDLLLKTQIDSKAVSNVRSLFELTSLEMCSMSVSAAEETKPAEKPAKPQYEASQEPVRQNIQPMPKTPAHIEPVIPSSMPTHIEPSQSVTSASNVPSQPTQVAPTKAEEPKPTISSMPKNESELKNLTELRSGKSLAAEGEPIILPDETMIQIMVLGGKYKAQRQELARNWGQFEAMKLDPKIGDAATLLAQARPFCLCRDALLINFNFTRLKDHANLQANQKVLESLLERVLGRKVFVYGLDRNDSNRVQMNYYSLAQLGRLPRLEDDELKLPC